MTKNTLKKAKQYSDLLLYEATGGSMGKAPDGYKSPEGMTFGEKKSLLTEMIKIAGMEHKVNPDDEETGFDIIKKAQNGQAAGNFGAFVKDN